MRTVIQKKKEGIPHIKAKLWESLKKNGKAKKTCSCWLSRGDVKWETESEIIAAKEQALQTRYHAIKILQTETENADAVNNLMRQ